MIIFSYLFLLFQLISAQRLGLRGERPDRRTYYNVAPRPGPGVGVLQDLSNARILSNEPFIISFEFPKLEKSGNSRRTKFGAKRSRRQKKKNGRLRQFRQVSLPGEGFLERAKRYQTLQKPLRGVHFKNTNLMTMEDDKARSLTEKFNNRRPFDRSGFERFQKFEDAETTSKPENEFRTSLLQQMINAKKEDNVSAENIEANNHKQWESIKGHWMSLFEKDKEPGNDVDEEQTKLKAKSQNMWANCHLLKLLKAPQRNPYFYKLLPANYPLLLVNEEKQLQCNKVYDIIDLSKDKKMIAEKVEHLEKILSSDNEDGTRLPVLWKTEEEPRLRKRRDIQIVEKKSEEQNTLQDESLQGKTEGEGRTDRNRRTKKRQNKMRRNRERGERKKKNRKQKESLKQEQGEKQAENEPTNKMVRNGRKVEEGQIMSNYIPKTAQLEESRMKLETHGHESEKKESEVKQEAILQDVFNPSEVNKVIKQKELEANIFDKVVRAMKKYEENNPYDESFVPRKRENQNETEAAPEMIESGESILEVDDAVRKLAKIFKILGVKAEAKKCMNCDASEENSSEEDDGKKKKTDRVRASKETGKCTCDGDCPVCHNCFRCFKECKKNMVSSRNKITAYTGEHAGLTSASKPPYSTGGVIIAEPSHEDTEPGRMNQPVAERMYRSKLPPSRDFVKMYFDNPDNKLLVWTKRGRRTMSWGPLTSDLQLYRDRAKQILKSAEDILQRIKETEERIHGTPQSYEIDREPIPVNSNNEKEIDDIIKKVVNEDAMKKFLTSSWKDRVEATEDSNKMVDGVISQEIQLDKDGPESTRKRDPDIITEEYGQAPRPDVKAKKETEIIENDDKALQKNLNSVSEKDLESIEAAVHLIHGSEEKTANTLYGDADTTHFNKEVEEQEEYEDIPAKVEAVSEKKIFKAEVNDNGPEQIHSESKSFPTKYQVEEEKVKKIFNEESEQEKAKMKNAFGKKSDEEEARIKKAFGEEFEGEEDKVKKPFSEEYEEGKVKLVGAFSEESEEEEEAKLMKAFSEESEEEKVKEKAFSEESEEEEEAKVKKAFSEESEEEKVKEKAFSEESEEEEEAKLMKAFSEESEEEKVKEKAFSEESEEEEEAKVKKAFSEESEEEKVKEKAFSVESEEEEEAKVKKAFSEESGERIPDSKSYEDIFLAEKVLEQGEKAEEKHKKTEQERNEEFNKYNIMVNNKVEGQRKDKFHEESEKERNDINDGIEPLEMRKFSIASEEPLEEKNNEKYDDIGSDYDDIGNMGEKNIGENDYGKDDAVERKNSYSDENNDMEEIKIGYIQEHEDSGEEMNSNKYRDDEVKEEIWKVAEEEEEKTKLVNVISPVEQRSENADAMRTKSADLNNIRDKINNQNIYEEHIKPLEEDYIIKGVKQTKEEKDAILKALLNAEGKIEEEPSKEETTEIYYFTHPTETPHLTIVKTPEHAAGDELQTLIQHIRGGYMNEDDFKVAKNLNESNIVNLVDEMQKNDKQKTTIDCKKDIELCKIACGCNESNSTTTEVDKYDIMKGFLRWLKDVQLDHMVPISI